MAFAFSPFDFAGSALMTGAVVVLATGAEVVFVTGAGVVLSAVAANTGAAITETASSAAEMVLKMVVSSLQGIARVAGRVAGLADHADDLSEGALNPP